MIGQTIFCSIVEELAAVDARSQQGRSRSKCLSFGSGFTY